MSRTKWQSGLEYDLSASAATAASTGYREYTAGLVQSGSSDPSASIMHSSLDADVTWTRVTTNVFSGSCPGAFPAGKFVSIPTVFTSGSNSLLLWTSRNTDDLIKLDATVISGPAVTGSILDNMLVSGAVVSFKIQLT